MNARIYLRLNLCEDVGTGPHKKLQSVQIIIEMKTSLRKFVRMFLPSFTAAGDITPVVGILYILNSPVALREEGAMGGNGGIF